MSEKDFDSSNIEYTEEIKSVRYVKQLQWDMAIGLQAVDDLKPSTYLGKLMNENISGNLSIEQIEKNLRTYYKEKRKKQEIDYDEMECDFVSTRIVELLQKDNFELSVDYFKVAYGNSLVRSNYFNNKLNIKEDKAYLIKFYENLLLGKNNKLHSQDLIVKELF